MDEKWPSVPHHCQCSSLHGHWNYHRRRRRVYQLTITNAYGSTTSRLVNVSAFSTVPPSFAITELTISGGNFSFTTPVLTSGSTYLVQTSSTLAPGSWITVQTIVGSGSSQSISFPYSNAIPGAFYRIMEQ
ncbi:MAG: hypothetical protein IPK32_21500 [Verrucomicrobiaceae bacterium]|nr:hypothetical protein [Verrucomicrobiaceae bacterium]